MKQGSHKKSFFYQISLSIIILLLAALYLYKERPNFKLPVLDKIDYLCQFNVKVASDSMEPFLINGQNYQFDKCFEASSLITGKVVSYDDSGAVRIGIIRQIFNNGAEEIYIISNERDNKLNYALLSDIYGTNDADTSTSEHNLEQSANYYSSITLASAYLAKIPKGTGIEISTPQRAVIFSKSQDQLCLVTDSPEQIFHYSAIIKNLDTNEIDKRGGDSVLRQGYNIECSDINLSSGKYVIIGTENHKSIFNFEFSVTE